MRWTGISCPLYATNCGVIFHNSAIALHLFSFMLIWNLFCYIEEKIPMSTKQKITNMECILFNVHWKTSHKFLLFLRLKRYFSMSSVKFAYYTFEYFTALSAFTFFPNFFLYNIIKYIIQRSCITSNLEMESTIYLIPHIILKTRQDFNVKETYQNESFIPLGFFLSQ